MPTCFVVQGFGKKTDFESGRVLDLDASYEVIKGAVEALGYECVRADEIKHARNIDQVMYEQLLDADLVIADLSTSNVNAFYELGVRFALRPRTTIVVAENKFNFPFDINHIPIRTYEHLGSDVGVKEARRFTDNLKAIIAELDQAESVDSPVYTFLASLKAPGFEQAATDGSHSEAQPSESVADLKRRAQDAMAASDFISAVELWTDARERGPKDDYVVQQLALATYKSKQPDELAALKEARAILEYLWPHESLDPETLGLWAAVHKRLFERESDPAALDEAIAATEKGFVLGENYYNGINLAFLLDTRATLAEPERASEDHAQARSVRRRVRDICRDKIDSADIAPEQRYWLLATLEEAAVGLGDEEEAARWHAEATAASEQVWQLESAASQIAKLRVLLAKVNPETSQ